MLELSNDLSGYLAEKRRVLADGYDANCLTIALEIAALLRAEGRQPSVATLIRVELRGEDVFYGPITPLKYEGRVTWTRHYVCCCDRMAYDPMLSEPVPVEDYSRLTFGVDIPLEECDPAKAMGLSPESRRKLSEFGARTSESETPASADSAEEPE